MYHEHLDLNCATASGKITRIWSKSSETVYMKVVNANHEKITILLNGKQLEENNLSLKKGDSIQINGFVDCAQYEIPLTHFFSRNGREKYLEELPELKKLISTNTSYKHFMMVLVPNSIDLCEEHIDTLIKIEGLITHKWKYRNQHFARMLSFDEAAPIEFVKEDGVIHRKPHVINLILPEPFYEDVKIRQRVRVTGTFVDWLIHEQLKRALKQLNQEDLIPQVPEEVLSFSIPRRQMFVNAKSMIIFST